MPKTDPVLVRPRHSSDLDALLGLAHRVKAVDGYPPRGIIDVDGFIAPPQELTAWVAEIDAGIVGHVALHGEGADDTIGLAAKSTGRPPQDLVVVARVLVSPSARRMGVGHALLAAATDGAHRRVLHPILEVATHFDAAIALYESCGWKRVGAVTMDFDDEPDLDRYVYVGPAAVSVSVSVSEDAVGLTRR